MIIFLLTFLFVYGGINVYAFVRARSILHFPLPVAIPIIVILVFLVLAPALVRISESRQLEALACTLAYIGYLWMAFIFLFFVSCLTFDAARYIFSLFQAAGRSPAASLLAFFLAVFISLALVIYGFRDAQIIRVKRLEINVNQALPDNGRLRIVQISDVHIGLIIQEKRLQKVLEAVKKENPDLLISTGDLLDGELNNVMPLASQFDQIKPKYGKFAVTGNHEFYAGIESALTFTRQAGFAVLRNEK
ncbi:MAG TPA: metallophosphoesterase, partial [Smithellaceae bacterium]|nr:metallophosphoesterase [Smithellaceae bacterium]